MLYGCQWTSMLSAASNGVQFVMTIHPDNFYRHGKKQIRIMDCVGHKYGTIFEARPYVDSEKEKKGEIACCVKIWI